MVLLRNKSSTLILSCICYIAKICYATFSDSDDDSIKEALVLVDILKKGTENLIFSHYALKTTYLVNHLPLPLLSRIHQGFTGKCCWNLS